MSTFSYAKILARAKSRIAKGETILLMPINVETKATTGTVETTGKQNPLELPNRFAIVETVPDLDKVISVKLTDGSLLPVLRMSDTGAGITYIILEDK